MKRCSVCRETKSRADYWKSPVSKDGLASTCKSCKSARQKDLYRKPVASGTKSCRSCGCAFDVRDFHVAPTYPDGRKPDCKRCHGAADRARRVADPRLSLLCHARSRAKRFGVPYDLDVRDIVVPETCPVLGIPIAAQTGQHADNSPSLDRLVPSRGYVRGNVLVVSYRANRLRNDASLAELEAVVAYVKREVKEGEPVYDERGRLTLWEPKPKKSEEAA